MQSYSKLIDRTIAIQPSSDNPWIKTLHDIILDNDHQTKFSLSFNHPNDYQLILKAAQCFDIKATLELDTGGYYFVFDLLQPYASSTSTVNFNKHCMQRLNKIDTYEVLIRLVTLCCVGMIAIYSLHVLTFSSFSWIPLFIVVGLIGFILISEKIANICFQHLINKVIEQEG